MYVLNNRLLVRDKLLFIFSNTEIQTIVVLKKGFTKTIEGHIVFWLK